MVIYSDISQKTWWFSIVMLVYQRVYKKRDIWNEMGPMAPVPHDG